MKARTKEPFILPSNVKRRLHYHAYRSQQRDQSEVCGVVLSDDRRSLELRFLPNRSRKLGHFELAINDIKIARRQAQEEGKKFVGIFHSHIAGEAVPSSADIKRAYLSHLQLIYDVCGRQVRMWRLKRTAKNRMAVEVSIVLKAIS